MRFQIDLDLHYQFDQANTVFLAVEAAYCPGQYVESEEMQIDRAELSRIAGDDGLGQRIWAQVPAGEMMLRYRATLDVTRPNLALEGMAAAPLHQIPGPVAPYLRPSRYCQSDKFGAFVGNQWGHLAGGTKVAAIRQWIQDELSYVPGSSDSDTHVLETFASRQGVCRDYAHMMCTMVRAAGIPARMVAVYSPFVTPQDFHAVAEVWLDGAWHLVDATGMCLPADMAVIAVGRDAYDVAFMDSQAPARMLGQSVQVSLL
ncbi:transglutaminase-like domain-containing protein [Pseudooceanicola sp. 200-1SW]|uniref:transglutaminase-like domain-containing protein n=1 Tax=Pseudooceanicola sp. 200-1SW TaxID=3425949 RepID=UPI003D7F69CD